MLVMYILTYLNYLRYCLGTYSIFSLWILITTWLIIWIPSKFGQKVRANNYYVLQNFYWNLKLSRISSGVLVPAIWQIFTPCLHTFFTHIILGFWSQRSACASATKWPLYLALFSPPLLFSAICSEQTWSLIGWWLQRQASSLAAGS